MNMNSFKEISEINKHKFSDCPLGKLAEGKIFDKSMSEYDKPLALVETYEKRPPIQNKVDGLERESQVSKELEKKYPNPPNNIVSEAYLRDKDGNILKDPKTGEARRLDFVVIKDGKAVDSIEVTSKTADKTEQSAKEQRIRDNGGNYIKLPNGTLAEIPSNVQTRIERRD